MRLRLFLLVLLVSMSFVAAQDYEKLAPFQDIAWLGGNEQPPIITLDGERYELLVINNLYIEDVVEFSLRAYDDNWQKRIAEDLVQVLSEMDIPPGETVSMLVRIPGEDETLELDGVPMTEANRNLVKDIRAERGDESLPEVSTEEMLADLDLFQEALETRFSYLHANDFDYQSRLEALRQEVRAGLSREAFGLGLTRIVAGFIDGHAQVRGVKLPESLEGYTPFFMNWAGERVVAVEFNRADFVDTAYPYIVATDGVPLARWLEAASRYVADGSPQLVRRRALGRLYNIQLFRSELGLPTEVPLSITLADRAGATTERRVEVQERLPSSPDIYRYRGTSTLLESNIGYLRLKRMNDEAVREIQTWLPRFSDTRGLIIDVRGNSGGSRDALRELFPHLMQEEGAVLNVAKYRLAPEFGEDHLGARAMYRAEYSGWSNAERRAVETFATSFEPEWRPAEEDFSAWHYVVVSRGNAEPYTAPVVVMMDAGSFSATDIFLSALATLPNVTLIGEASSGGSARVQGVTLPNTGLEVRLASMASFRPDGRLYDGRGVEPDIKVQPEPSFFLQGGEDTVLERAIEVISSQNASASD